MNEKKKIKISKFLSLVLRHSPETIGITLDEQGWVSIDELLLKMSEQGKEITLNQLAEVVKTNNKKRFSFNENQTHIKANQGHSVEINLNLSPQIPPSVLYHGTAKKNINSIFKNGLVKGKRHHVHLSKDIETAIKVGQRHGVPVVLKVLAKEMYSSGIEFFESENGVWLTEFVSTQFIEILEKK